MRRGPLCDRFPGLFVICANPDIKISDARVESRWVLRFHMTFGTAEIIYIDNLSQETDSLSLNDELYFVTWMLDASWCPSSSSM
jgi:hypothetical protein